MKRCAALLVLVLSSVSLVYAGINIVPMRFEGIGRPGDTIEAAYTITNPEKEKVRVNITSKDYYVCEENKGVKQEDWFEMPVREYDLEPNETKKVNFKIKVPQNVSGFLMVVNSFMAQKVEVDNSVTDQMLKTQFTLAIYVRIKDTEKFGLAIESLDLSESSHIVDAMAKVTNTGNSYVRPFLKVDFYKKGFLSSKKVGSSDLQQGWPVFPKQSEIYRGKLDAPALKDGKYKAVLTAWCDEDKNVNIKKVFKFRLKKNSIEMAKQK